MTRYLARYHCGAVRRFKAVNIYQARYKANGLAAANGWKLKTLGTA